MVTTDMRKLRKGRIALVVLLVALPVGAFYAHKFGIIGSGYGAQQTCACLYISGRTLDSCRGDLEPLAQKIVSLKAENQEVIAHTFGLMRARARYEEGFGCTLVE